MKKKITDNYRVEVFPLGENTTEKDCKKLADEINRHCDFSVIVIRYDTTEVCEFCNQVWETDDDGCPLCCNKAVKEFEDLKKEVEDDEYK